MSSSSLDYSKTYSSYSGVDIKVIIQGRVMGSMQAVSYAIQREKAPIYVMGSVDPISFSRGKRGIAGTMISLMLDKHFVDFEGFNNEAMYPTLDKDEVYAKVENLNDNIAGKDLKSVGGAAVDAGTQGAAVNNGEQTPGDSYATHKAFYVDQILPFDVAIIAANEYGQRAQMRLYGCEILNEGSGFSIDDIQVENQATYVCRTILPWRAWKKTSASDATTPATATPGGPPAN